MSKHFYRKVYIPILVSCGEDVVEGEEQKTTEDAERFGIAMADEFIEETGDPCYVRIELRLLPPYGRKENA